MGGGLEPGRRVITTAEILDVPPWIGRTAAVDGELLRVHRPNPLKPGTAIIVAGNREYSTGGDMLRRYFNS